MSFYSITLNYIFLVSCFILLIPQTGISIFNQYGRKIISVSGGESINKIRISFLKENSDANKEIMMVVGELSNTHRVFIDEALSLNFNVRMLTGGATLDYSRKEIFERLETNKEKFIVYNNKLRPNRHYTLISDNLLFLEAPHKFMAPDESGIIVLNPDKHVLDQYKSAFEKECRESEKIEVIKEKRIEIRNRMTELPE